MKSQLDDPSFLRAIVSILLKQVGGAVTITQADFNDIAGVVLTGEIDLTYEHVLLWVEPKQ